MMIYYELKKVFSTFGSRLSLIVAGAVLFLAVWLCVGSVVWVDDSGVSRKGPAAVHELRDSRLGWEGPLTEEKLALVIRENAKVNSSPEAQSDEIRENNIAFSRKQPFSPIRDLLNASFCSFREYDYYRADSLTEDDARLFYSNRKSSLNAWLNGEAKDVFTAGEKQFLLSRYDELRSPLLYENMDGWDRLFEYAPMAIMPMTLIICVLLAPIFSSEKQLRTASVYFSSLHGRGRAVKAKLWAGFLICTFLYWTAFLLYTAAALGLLGTGGAGCMIQANSHYWKCFYNITNLQLYGLVALGGYLGCLFMSSLTMLVSALSTSAVLAAIAPFLLILAPSMLSSLSGFPLMSKVISLLPDQLLQVSMAVRLFSLCSVGGKVTGAAVLLFAIYPLLTLLLQPAAYHLFRNKELG